MWVATTLETLSIVIEKLVDSYYYTNAVMTQILFGVMGIGLGGFLSTIVQFGIDQLHDASTNEISTFIMWYLCTFCGPMLIMNLTFYYLQWNHQYLIILGNLFLLINLSLVLVSLFYLNSWLIKEPVSQNPFKLIYKVSKFAIKNKHLKRRSAFTYCEDEPIGQIDYGKSKYGGPFTTEQVEDVKTFYRVLPIVILGGLLGGEMVAANDLEIHLKYQFVIPHGYRDTERVNGLSDYYLYSSVTNIIPYSAALLLMLYEVFIYPIFHRCFPQVTSLHKVFVGVALQMSTFLAFMTFEILSRQAYLKENGYNATASCVFNFDQNLETKFTYNWIAIPDTLFVLSALLMGSGGMEFILAQVPYSMKGIILGVGYCAFSSVVAINTAIEIPFKQRLSVWGTGIISCGFWFAVLHIVLCIFGCIIGALVIKWYKMRKEKMCYLMNIFMQNSTILTYLTIIVTARIYLLAHNHTMSKMCFMNLYTD